MGKPRDAASVDRFCVSLAAVMSQFPDMRIGQLIHNALYSSQPNTLIAASLFNVENDDLAMELVGYAGSVSSKIQELKDTADHEIPG